MVYFAHCPFSAFIFIKWIVQLAWPSCLSVGTVVQINRQSLLCVILDSNKNISNSLIYFCSINPQITNVAKPGMKLLNFKLEKQGSFRNFALSYIFSSFIYYSRVTNRFLPSIKTILANRPISKTKNTI